MKLKATKLDVDAPKLSRKRRTATRIEEFLGGKTAPEYAEIIFYYRRIYLESLDCIIDAMEDRFDQEDFNIHQTRKSLAESSQRRCLHPGLQ